VAGKLFEAAVKAWGSSDVTSASILVGLYKLKDETLGGLAAPLSYAEGKPHAVTCYFAVGIKDGQFTEPNGLTTECASDAELKILGGS
jgi:branched-chain amino acid transport system substrate-binding protein